EALHSGGDLGAVPNLVYRNDGEIVSNPVIESVHDLDQIPFPARDQFDFHDGRLAYIRVSTSRGCTSSCTFCNAPHARNLIAKEKVWRGASPARVVDEIEHLVDTFGFNTFDFVDSTFEDPGGRAKGKARIAEIAEEILRRDLKIY